jgi:hypothetical protein
LPAIETLVDFMLHKDRQCRNLERPDHEPEAWQKVSEELEWFTTPQAAYLVTKYGSIFPQLYHVFGFAKRMATGYAFISRSATQAHFVGYENIGSVVPGMVLLDATADIDGITSLCPWREHIEIPQASYQKLSIVHVEPHTKKPLKKFFEKSSNRHAYVEWMIQTIRQNMTPGQFGLVVCKKDLFANEEVPPWPRGDRRFDEPQQYTDEYKWEEDGRYLCATYWGVGIGSNKWQKADVVFLFDDWHLPNRVFAAKMQGHRNHKASEGALGRMTALHSRSKTMTLVKEGHLLRQLRQMAMRGKARRFDEHGVCGEQKLVYTGNYEMLVGNNKRLFPDAPITTVRPEGSKDTRATPEAFIELMVSLPPTITSISSKELSAQLGCRFNWGNVKRSPNVLKVLEAHGWKCPSGGRGRAVRFVRQPPQMTGGTPVLLAFF